MKASKLRLLFYLLLILGIIVCVYMLHLEKMTGYCPAKVCSPYPAILGLIWFIIAPVVFIGKKAIKHAWQVSGLVAVVVFLSIEILNSEICLFCSIAHIIGLLMIIISSYF